MRDHTTARRQCKEVGLPKSAVFTAIRQAIQGHLLRCLHRFCARCSGAKPARDSACLLALTHCLARLGPRQTVDSGLDPAYSCRQIPAKAADLRPPPHVPGRRSFCYRVAVKRALAISVAAALTTGLLCLVFLPAQIVDWDPIQFALGLDHFDLALHQPHAPGYVGPMALAWAITRLGVPAGNAVLWGSLVAGAVAAGALVMLGRRLYGMGVGVAAALLLATNPVAWSYALSGESYSAEAAVSILVVLAGLNVRRGASWRALVGFFVLYGLSGGVRQSVPLFMFPFAVWRLAIACRGLSVQGWLARFAVAAGAGVAGIAAWGIPLVLLAGGLDRLVGAFGSQFLDLFGRAYSPLMGASWAAVRTNLDGLWRFLLSGLSVGGVAGLLAWPLLRDRSDRGREAAATIALWVIPPLLWFVLMFIYKPGHVLGIVPAFALGAAAVLSRAGRPAPGTSAKVASHGSRVLGPALVGAVALAQAALFLAPPPTWTVTVGEQGLPALQLAQIDTAATAEALLELAGGDPNAVVVACRDGRFSFRRAMYHLPKLRVLWLMDRDSTGAPMPGLELCASRDRVTTCRSGAGFWQWSALPAAIDVPLAPSARYIAWFVEPGTAFDRALRSGGVSLRFVEVPPVSELVLTDLPPGPVDLRIGPWRFVR